jgi:hypothetical protein
LLYGDVSEASADARLQATSGFRTALVAGLAGLAALGSLAMATRTYRLTQQGQITERYTKAIEQLGSDKVDVRLGGIYALERIANDSPQDRATIAEVLTAFVRGHAPWPPSRPGQPPEDTPMEAIRSLRSWAPDVQAVLTVLGRRKPPISPPEWLDLAGTDLRRAHLYKADLRGAGFRGAQLQQATLHSAQLQRALFLDAVLQQTDLGEAQMQEALLTDADLQGAYLRGTKLQGAQMLRAQLRGAHLTDAQLQDTVLLDAQLQNADLTGAQLQGAGLHGAQLQEADLTGAQLHGAQCSAETVWPDGFDWEAAGVISERTRGG